MSKLILIILAFVIVSCNDRNIETIQLNLLDKIDKYNDTTFVSNGYIFPVGKESYLISDFKNNFIALFNPQNRDVKVIGKQGVSGNLNEFPFLPTNVCYKNLKLFFVKNHSGNQPKIIMYDIANDHWSELPLKGLREIAYGWPVDFLTPEMMIFKTYPTEKAAFVIYNVKNKQIKGVGSNLSKVYKNLRRPNFTIVNDNMLSVVLEKEGAVDFYSLKNGKLINSFLIPLNKQIKEILKKHPQAPKFQGRIKAYNNVIYICYNGIGMVAGKINDFGKTIEWTFLNFPNMEEDYLLMNDFIVTKNEIILFTEGVIKILNNPLTIIEKP